MIICDSCHAEGKIKGAPFNSVDSWLIKFEKRNLSTNGTSEELHLCLDCQKSFITIAASLRRLIEKYGVANTARHMYAKVETEPKQT